MKVIKYKFNGFLTMLPYTDNNLEIVQKEADNGKYTIEDDGQPEPESQPTTDERLTELEEAFELLLSGVTE